MDPESSIIQTKGDPLLVYFSGVSGNTKTFVDKLKFEAMRIPILPKDGDMPLINRPYILVVPSYGAGSEKRTVPKQIVKFLKNGSDKKNIQNCVGIIGGGNRVYGSAFCKAAVLLSELLKVPIIGRFEVLGNEEEVEKISSNIEEYWENFTME